MKAFCAAFAFGLIAASAAPVLAQQPSPSKDSAKSIPASARPPKGMCRIWIDGVAPAQQPAPTDCPTALKNQPKNSKVIFGDDFADTSKKAPSNTKVPPGAKGFQNVRPPVVILPTRPPKNPGD
jgi:predicted aconitase